MRFILLAALVTLVSLPAEARITKEGSYFASKYKTAKTSRMFPSDLFTQTSITPRKRLGEKRPWDNNI
ncbi:MAG: hypothetical protein EB060_04760 [Proteobacteria bacterium]|nr:hypothetical protein [Pseudomonadota bacterium]